MKHKIFSNNLFESMPLVGIVRGLSLDDLYFALPIFAEAGFTTVEITMNSPGAEELIASIASAFGDRLNVGAGTVCSPADLDQALNAGAGFIVTPIVSEPIIRSCVHRDVPVFPGAYTPTEIYRAWELGAVLVKVFPATSLGPGFIRDLQGPFPQIGLLPTGGVHAENLGEFFRAGAKGVGIGGFLFDKQLIAARDAAGLGEHFTRYIEAYRRTKPAL